MMQVGPSGDVRHVQPTLRDIKAEGLSQIKDRIDAAIKAVRNSSSNPNPASFGVSTMLTAIFESDGQIRPDVKAIIDKITPYEKVDAVKNYLDENSEIKDECIEAFMKARLEALAVVSEKIVELIEDNKEFKKYARLARQSLDNFKNNPALMKQKVKSMKNYFLKFEGYRPNDPATSVNPLTMNNLFVEDLKGLFGSIGELEINEKTVGAPPSPTQLAENLNGVNEAALSGADDETLPIDTLKKMPVAELTGCENGKVSMASRLLLQHGEEKFDEFLTSHYNGQEKKMIKSKALSGCVKKDNRMDFRRLPKLDPQSLSENEYYVDDESTSTGHSIASYMVFKRGDDYLNGYLEEQGMPEDEKKRIRSEAVFRKEQIILDSCYSSLSDRFQEGRANPFEDGTYLDLGARAEYKAYIKRDIETFKEKRENAAYKGLLEKAVSMLESSNQINLENDLIPGRFAPVEDNSIKMYEIHESGHTFMALVHKWAGDDVITFVDRAKDDEFKTVLLAQANKVLAESSSNDRRDKLFELDKVDYGPFKRIDKLGGLDHGYCSFGNPVGVLKYYLWLEQMIGRKSSDAGDPFEEKMDMKAFSKAHMKLFNKLKTHMFNQQLERVEKAEQERMARNPADAPPPPP